MKHVSTHFLRAVLAFIGLGALAVCVFALPEMWQGGSAEFPMASNAIFLIMMGLYATTIPFFVALWQALKLLKYIDQDKAFSGLSVKALRTIRQCAIAIAVLFLGGVPLLYPIADADDAPGLLIVGLVIACAPVVVAVFASVLHKVFQSAIEIQTENELTV